MSTIVATEIHGLAYKQMTEIISRFPPAGYRFYIIGIPSLRGGYCGLALPMTLIFFIMPADIEHTYRRQLAK